MPTRIDGVSSGGVKPAAGVTCADAGAAGTAIMALIRNNQTDTRRRRSKLSLLCGPHRPSQAV